MPPTTIMLIRHGEKPVSAPPYGVDADGNQDKHSLTVRGWQRAGALVNFFRSPTVSGVMTPTAIYASGAAAGAIFVDGDDVGKSLRPQQTVAPLAGALGLAVDITNAVGQEANLATAIRGQSGVVLVAWEHKHVPLIALQFDPTAPQAWPGGEVFDVVWILDASNGSYAFRESKQGLLSGDS